MSDTSEPKLNRKGNKRGMSENAQKALKENGFTSENHPSVASPAERRTDATAHRSMRKKARSYTNLAIETLVEVCGLKDNPTARVRAAAELLTRGYGRPHVQTEGKESQPTTKINVNFGTDAPPPVSVTSSRTNGGTLYPNRGYGVGKQNTIDRLITDGNNGTSQTLDLTPEISSIEVDDVMTLVSEYDDATSDDC